MKHAILEQLYKNGPSIQSKLNYYKEKMGNISLYLKRLTHLDQLIKVQIATIGTKSLKSQQYQDNMTINIDHQLKIAKNIQDLQLKKKKFI